MFPFTIVMIVAVYMVLNHVNMFETQMWLTRGILEMWLTRGILDTV